MGMENLSKLASLPSSVWRKLNSEVFLRRYGKNILKIEGLFVFIAVSTFALQFFLPANILSVTFFTWFIAFFSAILFLQSMFSRIGKREICPYEILRQIRIRSVFLWSVVLSVPVFFLVVFVWGSILADEVLSASSYGSLIHVFPRISIILNAVGIYFLVILPSALSAYFLSLNPLRNREIARLTFRTVLVGLALIRKEETSAGRLQFVKKYIKWFRHGLRSYNKYLYETNPVRLQITNAEDYYSSLCSVASIGNLREQTIVLEQFRLALCSVKGKFTKDEQRHFLVALKNIHDIRRKKDYPSDELHGMLRPQSLLERIRDYLSHPFFKGLVVLVPIIAAIVSVLSNFHII